MWLNDNNSAKMSWPEFKDSLPVISNTLLQSTRYQVQGAIQKRIQRFQCIPVKHHDYQHSVQFKLNSILTPHYKVVKLELKCTDCTTKTIQQICLSLLFFTRKTFLFYCSVCRSITSSSEKNQSICFERAVMYFFAAGGTKKLEFTCCCSVKTDLLKKSGRHFKIDVFLICAYVLRLYVK